MKEEWVEILDDFKEDLNLEKPKINRKKKYSRRELLQAIKKEFLINFTNVYMASAATGFVLANPKGKFASIVEGAYIVAGIGLSRKASQIEKEKLRRVKVTSFKESVRRIRKVVVPVLVGAHVTALSMNMYSFANAKYINNHLAISKTPVYTAVQTATETAHMNGVAASHIIIDVEDNVLLSENEKEQLRRLYPYFNTNPYIAVSCGINNFKDIDVFYEESESKQKESVAAQYFRDANEVAVYNGANVENSLPHEFVHASGHLDTRFLNEGMTSIIVAEYCDDGEITNAYESEVFLTEIIIELTGKDKMLEAYNKDDQSIIMNELERGNNSEYVKKMLESFDEFSEISREYYRGKINYEKYEKSCMQAANCLANYLDYRFRNKNPKDPEKTITTETCFEYFKRIVSYDFEPLPIRYNQENIRANNQLIEETNPYETVVSVFENKIDDMPEEIEKPKGI